MSSTGRIRMLAMLPLAALAAAVVIAGNAGQARADPMDGLNVADVSVTAGSGAHAQTVTIAAGSPIVGSTDAIFVDGTLNKNFVTAVSAGASTQASCAPGLANNWVCKPSAHGWGAGTLTITINVPQAPLYAIGCGSVPCVAGMEAIWKDPMTGIRSEGAVAVLGLTNTSTEEAYASRASPPFSVSGINILYSPPYRSHRFWPVALVVPAVAAFGIAVGIFAGRRRRRRTTGSDD